MVESTMKKPCQRFDWEQFYKIIFYTVLSILVLFIPQAMSFRKFAYENNFYTIKLSTIALFLDYMAIIMVI